MEDKKKCMFAYESKNGFVYAYDSYKKQILEEKGTLVGYTSDYIAVKRDNTIYIYDTSNRMVAKHPYDFGIENISGVNPI